MGVTEALVRAAIEYRKLYATNLTRETCLLGDRQRSLLEAVDAYQQQEAGPVNGGPRPADAPSGQRQGVAPTVSNQTAKPAWASHVRRRDA